MGAVQLDGEDSFYKIHVTHLKFVKGFHGQEIYYRQGSCNTFDSKDKICSHSRWPESIMSSAPFKDCQRLSTGKRYIAGNFMPECSPGSEPTSAPCTVFPLSDKQVEACPASGRVMVIDQIFILVPWHNPGTASRGLDLPGTEHRGRGLRPLVFPHLWNECLLRISVSFYSWAFCAFLTSLVIFFLDSERTFTSDDREDSNSDLWTVFCLFWLFI